MTVWALKDPDEDEYKQLVVRALDRGECRFGWGYIATADLRILSQKNWQEMNDDEKLCWAKSRFFMEIEPLDWVVHVNIPSWGLCTAVQVCGEYRFDQTDECSDFGHCVPVDLSTKVVFDRNDARLHERVSKSLKPRQRYQRVHYVNEFLEGLEALKGDPLTLQEGQRKGTRFFKEELKPQLKLIAEMIHRNYPGKTLEYFFKDVFETIPGVTNVVVNGSGWGTDYGADVIVTYTSGLPIANLGMEQTLVVQVKSFGWKMYDQTAIEQVQSAIEKYHANAGLIFSTAEASEEFKKKLEDLNRESDVPVVLIAGDDVARFILKYGGDILFEV